MRASAPRGALTAVLGYPGPAPSCAVRSLLRMPAGPLRGGHASVCAPGAAWPVHLEATRAHSFWRVPFKKTKKKTEMERD